MKTIIITGSTRGIGLGLSREFHRLDELVDGLRSGYGASSGDEVFVCVHVLRFVLKERNCSLHPPRESRTAPDKTHPPVPAPPGSGASATE